MISCFRLASCWGLQRRGMASKSRDLYDVLGVTPRASSKQIKAAYFKLSKDHHPDRHGGDAVKFQQISAAYEVLGNRRQRRVYDSEQHRRVPGAPTVRQPRPPPGRATPHTGRSAHFNFDAWSQAHYEDVRRREKSSRAEYSIAVEKRLHRREERLRGVACCVLLVGMALYMGVLMERSNHQGPQAPRPTPAKPPS